MDQAHREVGLMLHVKNLHIYIIHQELLIQAQFVPNSTELVVKTTFEESD